MMSSQFVRGSVLLMVLALGVGGCLKRFNSCDTNVECTERTQEGNVDKPYCENLRCVECRSDADCKKGFCNLKTNECQTVD